MPDLLTVKDLSLISFKVYRQLSDGSWSYRSTLHQGVKYRFRFVVKNKSTDTIYVRDVVRIGAHPNFYFYHNPSCTGRLVNSWASELNHLPITPNKSRTIYAYFKWNGQNGWKVSKLFPGLKISLLADEKIYAGSDSDFLVPNA